MRRILLLSSLLLVGCATVAKSEFYESVNPQSVADTVQELDVSYYGDVNLGGMQFELWESEDLELLSRDDRNIDIITKSVSSPEDVELILSDYDINTNDQLDRVLDKDNETLVKDNDNELFLLDDYITLNNEDVGILIIRDFNVLTIDDFEKYFRVSIFYDLELFEVAKTDLLK